MVKRWQVNDLDPDCLFEVTDNRDPETSARFSWPIPNWLDETGKPGVSHPDLSFVDQKGEFRLWFRNFVDNCDQYVKVDGTGTILFMTPTPTQAERIRDIILSVNSDITQMTPDQVVQALDRIYTETGLIDRYNSSHRDLDSRFDAVPGDVENGYFGRFVYKYSVYSALYLGGDGTYDGMAGSSQRFSGGGFVVFPGMRLDEAREHIRQYNPLNPAGKPRSKIIGFTEFLKTRRIDQGPDSLGLAIRPGDLKQQIEPRRRFYKPKPVPGFPDRDVELRAVEQEWLSKISGIYALHGYPEMQLRAMEDYSVLRTEEGDIDLEETGVFAVVSDFRDTALPRYGLRFDHTLPLARWLAEHKSQIISPFKSARIGTVWRRQDVERGKVMEFTQADIDVVGMNNVSPEYDAELPRIMLDVISKLEIPSVEISVSNIKITQGFFEAQGFDEATAKKIIRLIELRHKLGMDGIRAKLNDDIGLDTDMADLCIRFASIKTTDTSFRDQVLALGRTSSLLEEGLSELEAVMARLSDIPDSAIVADMSVVRGMDYYTGTVFEGRCKDQLDYPPIIFGGRYDNLVGQFMPEKMPGVGISFDVTCALEMMEKRYGLQMGAKTSTQVVVTYLDESQFKRAEEVASQLRQKGTPTELVHTGDRRKQFEYANRMGIPYVAFINERGDVEMRNMRSTPGEPYNQIVVDPTQWKPSI